MQGLMIYRFYRKSCNNLLLKRESSTDIGWGKELKDNGSNIFCDFSWSLTTKNVEAMAMFIVQVLFIEAMQLI